MSDWSDKNTNYAKLCKLLYDGGSQAIRSVFDSQCPPSTLVTTLNSNQPKLLKLKKPKGRVLSGDQWDKLYPPSGATGPKSEDFDITLLFVLLRNICPGIAQPTTGWNNPPHLADSSCGANLVRIKLHRNKVIAHSSSAEVEDANFTTYWNEISTTLVLLGLKQDSIDKLKSAPLGEKDYNQLLNEWSQADEDIKYQLEVIKSATAEIKCSLEEIKNQREVDITRNSPISKLACVYFDSVVSALVRTHHPNTREWVFDEVRSYLESEQSESTMVVIEAGPGMGKSVIAAKICDMYKGSEGIITGACHFFQHNNMLRNDPRQMLQSIARQLCYSVPGYEDALKSKLDVHAERIQHLGCRELFPLLLEEPCCKLKSKDTVVVVIDALDECDNTRLSELCGALGGISNLPSWLRFVITTRPPPSISSFRRNTAINCTLHIKAEDPKNKDDLGLFFTDKLKDLGQVSSSETRDHDIKHLVDSLVDTTEGIFLVAFFVIDILTNKSVISLSEVVVHFPKGKGITSVYEDYFNRLKKAMLPHIKSEEGFFQMLDAVVEAKFPIEKNIFYGILGLIDEPRVPNREREEAINLLHQLFPVENDHVSAFHKTVIDWLTAGEHIYQVKHSNDVIAKKCYEVLTDIKRLKNLEEPPIFTSSERYAIQFGESYMRSQSFDEAKRVGTQNNCFVVCLRCMRYRKEHSYGDLDATHSLEGAISWEVKTIDDLFKICLPRYVDVHSCDCQLKKQKTLKQEFEPILQMLHLLDVTRGTQLTPKPVQFLKKYGLPYNERQIVIKAPPGYGHNTSISIPDGWFWTQQANVVPPSAKMLTCHMAFFLIQYPYRLHEQGKMTLIQKYQLDGTLVSEKEVSGHKKMFMSPDSQFIVAIPVFTKENIVIIDATTLKIHSSYKPPNVIRSCHVYGSQPWCILARCVDNKIYVMEGETGNTIHQPIGVDQFDEVEAVSSQGHIVLSRNEISPVLLTVKKSTQSIFADVEGTLFEQMIYEPINGYTAQLIRKLHLCHFGDSLESKMCVYPQTHQCTLSGMMMFSKHFDGQAMCFSNDGSLFAFHYRDSITVINTCNGSVHRSVFFKRACRVRQILYLAKHVIFCHDHRYFLCINLETKQLQHVFSVCTTDGSPSLQNPALTLEDVHIVPGFVGSREVAFLSVSSDLEKLEQLSFKERRPGEFPEYFQGQYEEDKRDLSQNRYIYKHLIFGLDLFGK